MFTIPRHNLVRNGDGFYISYNPVDVALYGCTTTALVKGQMERFYILDGNHLDEYAPLIDKGFEACLDYFKANILLKNHRSDDLPEGS